MGLAQVWKTFRDIPVTYPPYARSKVESPLLAGLESSKYHNALRHLRVANDNKD